MSRTINVENNEMFETPMGEVGTFKGATHASGGIDTTVPSGTKIYSDKIKVGEHTMAERKAYRTKMLTKLLSKHGDTKDPFMKNTVARTIESFKAQEAHDMAIQDLAKETETAMFEGGGTVFDNESNIVLHSNPAWKKSPFYGYTKGVWSRIDANGNVINTIQKGDPAEKQLNDYYFKQGNYSTSLYEPKTTEENVVSDLSFPSIDITPSTFASPRIGTKDGKAPNALDFQKPLVTSDSKFGSDFSTGDYIGMTSAVAGPVAQMINTLENAKNTKQVVNHYDGINEKAIQTTNEAIDETGYGKDIAKRALQRVLNNRANSSRENVRGSATSINSLRAMDLGVDTNMLEAEVNANNQLEATFGQQKMQLLGTKGQLESQASILEAQGQTQADDANAAGLDNFYSNFGQNLADMTTAGQALGRNLNQNKYNKDFLKILPSTNRWGIGFDKEMNMFANDYTK